MYWIALLAFGFLTIRLLISLVNLLSRTMLAEHGEALSLESPLHNGHPMVSVLIPARNEAKNIGRLLDNLIVTHPSDEDIPLEILVYDDLSEDNTADIVSDFARKDRRISLIQGKELPAGWLGKNHACHNLSLAARGRYFLFLDADVIVEEGLVSSALSHLLRHKISLLSIFPQQLMHSIGERATVPLMNWILVSLLPLMLTRLSARPSFSAANGQFMLFDAQTYRQHNFHEMVKHHKVEDILIFKQMKSMGFRVQTLLSNGMIKCRMYGGFRDALGGFSKNVFAFFGGSMLAGIAYSFITTIGFIPVWISWGPLAAAMYLGLGMVLRAMVSLASRQPAIQNILLSPLQQFAFFVVIGVATYKAVFGKNVWKGRNIDLSL